MCDVLSVVSHRCGVAALSQSLWAADQEPGSTRRVRCGVLSAERLAEATIMCRSRRPLPGEIPARTGPQLGDQHRWQRLVATLGADACPDRAMHVRVKTAGRGTGSWRRLGRGWWNRACRQQECCDSREDDAAGLNHIRLSPNALPSRTPAGSWLLVMVGDADSKRSGSPGEVALYPCGCRTSWICLVSPVGFEPTAPRLKVSCSTD